jgi:hypothetical protein
LADADAPSESIVRERDVIKEAVMYHEFTLATGAKLRFTTLGRIVVLLVLFIIGIFVIASFLLETMAFDFGGLAGALLEKGVPGSSYVKYSVYTIFDSLPEASGQGSSFMIVTLQLCFLFFSIICPLALVASQIIFFVYPMTLSVSKLVSRFIDSIQAWSALEVFCFAVLATLIEIQQFVAFIVGDSCDGLDAVLAEYADELLDGDDTCFDVQAVLLTNAGVLLITCVLLCGFNLPMLGVFHTVCAEREVLEAGHSDVTSRKFSIRVPSTSLKTSNPLKEPLLEVKFESEDADISNNLSTQSAIDLLPLKGEEFGDSDAEPAIIPSVLLVFQAMWLVDIQE